MPKKLPFFSTDQRIPPLRRDISLQNTSIGEEVYIAFHDAMGYAKPGFALHESGRDLLSVCSGHFSFQELAQTWNTHIDDKRIFELRQFVKHLDEAGVLDSSYLRQVIEEKEQEFISSDYRPAVCAGSSYPAEPQELQSFLEDAFGEYGTAANPNLKALYAPHIDLRVGLPSYAEAFSMLADHEPETVVIIATSHYSGYYPKQYQNRPVILSTKAFETPLGRVETNLDLAQGIYQAYPEIVSVDDRAHRVEHSIELHLVFLQHVLKKPFTIVPLLVGGLDEILHMENGSQGKQIKRFGKAIESLMSNGSILFTISGDLSHVGKKFGDGESANEMKEAVQEHDEAFIQRVLGRDPAQVQAFMADTLDKYRVCGFPPLYTFIQGMQKLKPELINYDWWDEAETESAVSFASIGFFG